MSIRSEAVTQAARDSSEIQREWHHSDATNSHLFAQPLRWAVAAADAAEQRNGLEILVIDVGDVLGVTDLFVITHGNNARQVRAIAEGVEELLKQAGGPSPVRIEGAEDRQWVLIDYGSFVVHVFDAERRALYQLERLWGDCPVLDWRSLAKT